MITINLRWLGVKRLILPRIREIQYKNFELVRTKHHGLPMVFFIVFAKIYKNDSKGFYTIFIH
ncbi:hypothetical protein BSU00_00180 [Tenacibaculum sp. SG-28]|nr:hypothetical protein BSU00_00180 [Tenacibaculum sp. SG-28]